MIKDVLTKKPFVRVLPTIENAPRIITDRFRRIAVKESNQFVQVNQSDFPREYYTSGHKINNTDYYPDKIKYDEEKKQFFTQKVIRVAFPFQYIISAQQLVHLCGNDIKFELSGDKQTQKEKDVIAKMTQGWLDKNMEVVFYEFAKSVKNTADGAIVFSMYNGKLYTKNLSFSNGDKLYPHYNSITGDLEYFAREYSDFDVDGNEVTSWVELWDEKYFYRYKRSKDGVKNVINNIKKFFNIEDYALVSQSPHGFKRVPVAYLRNDDGACWSQVQDLIDKFELAISHLCQNNMAFAFPIMVLKGSNVEVQGDVYGDVKAISISEDNGDAHYISAPQASESFKIQLETLLKGIFLGSFTVLPPEIKSGDLPGVAIKLIYSPSYERALIDAKEFDKALDTIVELYKYGYGIECGMASAFQQTHIFAWIEPYIHSNTAELIQNLAVGVQNGFISRETAAEKSTYEVNDELFRLIKQRKEDEQADVISSNLGIVE